MGDDIMTGTIDQRFQGAVRVGLVVLMAMGLSIRKRGGNGYGIHNYSCYHHVGVGDAAVLDYRNGGINHLFFPKQDG